MVYTHILSELNLSKLYSRSVKISLLGYFRHDGYKLLEKSTGTVFRSRDVIFEEGVTHLAKQPTPVIFPDNNNPFSYSQKVNTTHPETESNKGSNISTSQATAEPLHNEIAPRPLPITDLHRGKAAKDPGKLLYLNSDDIPRDSNAALLQKASTDLPLAIKRICWKPKPSTRFRESHEYLGRPCTFMANMDT